MPDDATNYTLQPWGDLDMEHDSARRAAAIQHVNDFAGWFEFVKLTLAGAAESGQRYVFFPLNPEGVSTVKGAPSLRQLIAMRPELDAAKWTTNMAVFALRREADEPIDGDCLNPALLQFDLGGVDAAPNT